jgi:3-oxoacyl-[acyl-carrier-protein] synthase II
MRERRVILRGLSTLSAVGSSPAEVGASFKSPCARTISLEAAECGPVFPLSPSSEALVEEVREVSRYSKLDRVTLLALASARRTLASFDGPLSDIGSVTVGSSRGPTASLERTIEDFIGDAGHKVPVDTSPTTTAGNISSWVAQELVSRLGAERGAPPIVSLGTSMTCTSGFHALLVSLGFLRGGLSSACLVGGAEACLTPYTVSQLQALRIYGRDGAAWPCRPLSDAVPSENTVVLGEGVGTAVLCFLEGLPCKGDLELLGIGWALEEVPSATGLSADGRAFEASMRMACRTLPEGVTVDAVVLHAPGSLRGDEAELAAVARTFGEVPLCTTKHLTGHTYGASGFVSLELARYLLEGGQWGGFPYKAKRTSVGCQGCRAVLVNTAGFGGNSISVVVALPGERVPKRL